MISATALRKTFYRKNEPIEAVKGIDVDVAEGELVAFLGPNGAGKSTTLRMLTSLLQPTSGTAKVAGWDVVQNPDRVRANLGFIGQGTGGGFSYRVRDELHSQGRFYGLPRSEYRARTRELITALELDGLERRNVQSLSGGQRRRLDVALGLINRPPLLFLDEPTTGLDPHSRANLWEHITAMRSKFGMTMVLTTHYLEEADSMAERVIIIDHGEIIADATAAQLKRDHAEDLITVRVTNIKDDTAHLIERELGAAFTRVDIQNEEASLVVRVATEFGAQRLPEAIRLLGAAGVDVAEAEVRQASLDDVFLNLTGRRLREGL